MLKKFTALVFSILLIICLVGCEKDKPVIDNEGSDPTSRVTAALDATDGAETDESTETLVATETAGASETPVITETPEITATPEVSATPEPTDAPVATNTPEPTKKPNTPTPTAEPTVTPEPEKNWELYFYNELCIVAAMAERYTDTEEFEFYLDAFLYTGTKPNAYKSEEVSYDEELDETFYRYYYKKSDVDAWSLKYFGMIFDDDQYQGTHYWAYTYKLEGDSFVVTQEYIDPRGSKYVRYVSHEERVVNGEQCYVLQCKRGYEGEPEAEWSNIEVILAKTQYGHALRAINSK